MGYMKIKNLYKDQDILLFKECYALQKIHGTSAHIAYKDSQVIFFAGGSKYDLFITLFDQEDLQTRLEEKFGFETKVVVYGEAYGGKLQGMSDTYGPNLKFVVFDIKIGDKWLDVPSAHGLATKLGLEFVYYERIKAEIEEINRMRDMDSMQGIRNGMPNMPEEGVVLRPLIELIRNNGSRLICKHKKDNFRETNKPRKVDDPAKLERLSHAEEIANEWVTQMRLLHVIDELGVALDTHNLSSIIPAMINDIKVESEGEVEWTKECEKAIGKNTAKLVKRTLQCSLS